MWEIIGRLDAMTIKKLVATAVIGTILSLPAAGAAFAGDRSSNDPITRIIHFPIHIVDTIVKAVTQR